MNLSKSRYTKGVQCPKILWMQQHMADRYDASVENQAVLENGDAIGDLAMGYYGEFIEVPFIEGNMQAMLEATQQLLAEGHPVICEASFAYDGNFCSVDILRIEDDGVHIVEVKSSTDTHEIYLHDMAFQTWVLRACGLMVKSVSLMHVNRHYVRQGELDLRQFMTVEDHTEEVFEMLDEVGEMIPYLKHVADQPEEPTQVIGGQCKKPYECGFRGWCWRDVPADSVFDLNNIRMEKALSLYFQGIRTMPQAMAAGTKLSPRQLVQATCDAEGKNAMVDRAAVAAFLGSLEFPLYVLDFETVQPAIPLYDGTTPFQQIPTQYSLHVLRAPGEALEHYEFLAQAGEDPRRAVAEHLVADIPMDVCTLAYNMSFEKGRIKEMAEAFPDFAEHLMDIHDRIRDLIEPFRSGAYYNRAMGGSNSIKAVLPALCPDDPALDYHALEGVHNGSEAMNAFADLEKMSPEDAARTREQLLRYCELDTLAMVKVWEKLVEAVEG